MMFAYTANSVLGLLLKFCGFDTLAWFCLAVAALPVVWMVVLGLKLACDAATAYSESIMALPEPDSDDEGHDHSHFHAQ